MSKPMQWDMSEFDRLRRAPGVQEMVERHTADFAERCGRGYEGSTQQGRTRFRGIVYPGNSRARRDHARNQTMLKRAAESGMRLGGVP